MKNEPLVQCEVYPIYVAAVSARFVHAFQFRRTPAGVLSVAQGWTPSASYPG